jgi:transcriptional regulator with XRE-family HTH domain
MLKSGVDTSKMLAAGAGISVNTISRLLNGGSTKLPTLRRIATALNIDPIEIIEAEA